MTALSPIPGILFDSILFIKKLLRWSPHRTPAFFIGDVVATRFTANGDQVFLTNVTGVITLTGDPEHPLTKGTFRNLGLFLPLLFSREGGRGDEFRQKTISELDRQFS